MSQEGIVQTLVDAGCTKETIAAFLKAAEAGQTEESIRLLRQHRCALLDILHKKQRQIECLDYLLYQLRKSPSVLLPGAE